MNNELVNIDSDVQPPPSKRIKLEEDPDEERQLLSRKRRGRGRPRPKSTIEDRALVLLNDDRISAVEPQQVLCRMCGHWVKLFKHTDYSPANWRTHAEKCESRSRWKSRIQADPGALFTLTIPASLKPGPTVPAADAVSPSSVADTAPTSSEIPMPPNDNPAFKEDSEDLVEPELPLSGRRATKSTTDRRRELENDPRCEKPGPHSVFCKMCEQWVRLHNIREYDLWNWLRHAEKCEVRNGWVKHDFNTIQSPKIGLDPDIESLRRSHIGPVRTLNSCRTSNGPKQNVLAGSSRSRRRVSRLTATAFILDPTANRQKELTPGKSRTVSENQEDEFPCCSGHAVAEINHSDLPRSFGDIRVEEIQTDERIHKSNGAANTTDSSLSKLPLHAAGPTVPLVKAEPTDLDESLFPVRVPMFDQEGNNLSTSTGIKRRKGRTVEERRQALLDDPRIDQVLPNEVLCKMCNKWIKLYKEVDYVESNWTRHAERCSLRLAAKNVAKTILPTPPVSVSSAAASSPTKRSPVKSTEERLRDLQGDSRIEAIEPHQVLCGICKQWIKLQSYRDYDIWNWRKHVPLCEQRHFTVNESALRKFPGRQQDLLVHSESKRLPRAIKVEEIDAEPSSSAATAHLTAPPKLSLPAKAKDESTVEERRAILERDGRCENIDPQHVTCKVCNRVVGLHVKKDYSLSNWYKHIASCNKQSGKQSIGVRNTTIPAGGLSTPQTTAVNESSKAGIKDSIRAQDADVQFVVSAPVHTGKANKSTAEDRRAKLLADPRVETVEPNRIKCKLCQHWLKLNEFMDYAPYNWYKHIERCEVRNSLDDPGTSDAPIMIKEEETELSEVKVVDEPSISTDSGVRKRTTPAERLARMQADPRIKTIEKHRCRCCLCDKWVKLQNKTEYDPHNWFAHIKKCAIRSNASPIEQSFVPAIVKKQEFSPTVNSDLDTASGLVERDTSSTILNRRAVLLNDSRSSAVEPHRVLCGICQQWIKLRDGKDYVPYNWFKHKRKCERRHGLLQTNVLPNENTLSTLISVKKEPASVDTGLYSSDHRKMTDDEREAQLRADPRLGDVEPGRVFCRMCDNWIKLNMSTGFLRGNWLRHAQRCKGRTSWQGATPETTEEPPELSSAEVIDLEATGGHFGYIELGRLIGKLEPMISSTEYGNPPETKAPREGVKQQIKWSIPTLRARPNSSRVNSPAPLTQGHSESRLPDTGKRMHRTEGARKQELQNDPRTKIVHPDKILCAMCDRWIQMRRDVSYSPQNWLKHAGICEQRTGWLNKHKSDVRNEAKPDQLFSQDEEFVPYNARVRAEQQQQPDFDPPVLKPVDWVQVVGSDDDDDEVQPSVGNQCNAKPGAAASSTNAYSKSLPGQPPLSIPDAEPANKSHSQKFTNTPKMSVLSPLAGIRADKADFKANPPSIPASTGVRIPSSTSPPLLAPFTTVPLTYYRATYAPHMVQSGFSAPKDSAPPKSASPQNTGTPRALPFVVPAAAMLPHLLPRPVLVPISHTSRQASGAVSPFRLPTTPPVPPVGQTATNGSSPVPSAAANVRPAKGTGKAVSTVIKPDSPAIPAPTAESSGVAVPTPIRSVPDHDSIMSSTEPNGSPQLPGSTGSNLLQLCPDADRPKEKSKAVGTATSQIVSGVLQLGPKASASKASEKLAPDKREPAAKPLPNVLQLGPRMDLLLDREKEKHKAEKSVPSLPAKLNPEVLQLAPNSKVFREKEKEKAPSGEVQEASKGNSELSGKKAEPDGDVSMTSEDVTAPAGPSRDVMLVDA